MRTKWLGRVGAMLTIMLAVLATGASVASASHFRGGQITWKRSSAQPSKVDFQVTGSFRRDGYSGTASDGYAAVGDVIDEDIGGTSFDFGDGVYTDQLQFKVVAVVPAENYLIARALDPGSRTDTVLHHDYAATTGGYPGTGTFTGAPVTAAISSCCTIGELFNNASGTYRVETKVSFTGPTTSPVSSLQPIVNVGTTGTQTFGIPSVVSAGTTRRYRLATAAEACEDCFDPQPAGLAIDPVTGVVTWDTTGKPLGLYFASVVVESRDASQTVVSTAQQTFLVRITSEVDNDSAGFYPSGDDPATYAASVGGTTFPGSDGKNPPDGSTFFTPPNQGFRLKVSANDPTRPNAVLHVDHLGLPDGATFTSADGNPASGLVVWSPQAGQVGDFIVTFTVSRLSSGARKDARAGGVNTQTISYTLKVDPDATPPTTTTVSLPDCTQTGALAFSVADSGSGVDGLLTRLDGQDAVLRRVDDAGAVTLAVPDEGAHTLSYRGRDLNGNLSPEVVKAFRTDRTAPTVTLLSSSSSFVLGSAAAATAKAVDPAGLETDPSGTIALDTGSLGAKTVSRSATDKCGNSGKAELAYTVTAPPATQGEVKPPATTPPVVVKPVTGTTTTEAKKVLTPFVLPSTSRCIGSKRTIRIAVKGKTALKKLTVSVNGKKRTVTVKGKSLTIKLPKRGSRFKVALSSGKESTKARTYKACS